MPRKNCIICKHEFYARPSQIINGWGKYCSTKCQYQSFKTGIIKKCFTCGNDVYLTLQRLRRSKSEKYFCNKSCQTKWRNVEFSGTKHINYKSGNSIYQSILKRNKVPQICFYCGTKDTRVLATHHIDENHRNNEIKNLVWLCHNCHSRVHYDRLEKRKFIIKYNKKL